MAVSIGSSCSSSSVFVWSSFPSLVMCTGKRRSRKHHAQTEVQWLSYRIIGIINCPFSCLGCSSLLSQYALFSALCGRGGSFFLYSHVVVSSTVLDIDGSSAVVTILVLIRLVEVTVLWKGIGLDISFLCIIVFVCSDRVFRSRYSNLQFIIEFATERALFYPF